jgi:phosphoribosylamine---glycine ligase
VKILVVGSGGREHALVWGLARSNEVDAVVAAPGNPGIAELARCVGLDAEDPNAVAQLADEIDADLVVVGPEVPLVNGAVDAVQARGRRAFGPNAAAARLEGSKAWMKALLARAGVPTALHATFTYDEMDAALAFLETLDGLYVVKTDGLAGGKGVVVTESIVEARDAVRAYLSGAAFGDAGRTVVVEEGISGPELSLLVVCNGVLDAAVPLAPAQDFKRADAGDLGPNTGGMGAYSPVPLAGSDLVEQVMTEAIVPTLSTLARDGITYRGILYAGLMLTTDGPKILEYNVRFGDPECQVVVPRLTTDLAVLCHAAAGGDPLPVAEFSGDACVTVVMASEGYPAAPRVGDTITGIAAAGEIDGVTVFHAGTARGPDGGLRTSGGRVLDVTATGPTVAAARDTAYAAVERITWRGVQYRPDIAATVAATP